jgi:hypothetical protein
MYCIILRKTRIIASMKDKGQRTRDSGTEDGKQRNKGQKQWNRATEKGEKRGWETGERSSETDYRGRETRKRD